MSLNNSVDMNITAVDTKLGFGHFISASCKNKV